MPVQLVPGQPAPALRFETLTHGPYDLATAAPPGGSFVVFHRGAQCKWTRNMLKELDDRIGDFAIRGMRVVVLSSEGIEKTTALKETMQLIRLPLGHSVEARAVAADWGVYLTAQSPEAGAEPLHFEPAQFWIRADGTVGLCACQSAPNLWADATSILRAIDTTQRDPSRGAFTG